MKKYFIIVLIAICFNQAKAQLSVANYKIINKISVTGDGGWDYLNMDVNIGRLFISHGNMVQVLDVKSQKIIGTINDTKGVHGIALAKNLNKGYISCGKDTSVTVFNLETYEFIDRIKVTGLNPDAILFDSVSNKIFTFNGRGSNATVIDAKTDKVINTIVLPGKPEFAVTDNHGMIYVNIEDKSEIVEISTDDFKIKRSWSIAPGVEPSGLAIDQLNHLLFSVCDNKLMVISSIENGKVVTSAPIGEGVDGVAYDPSLQRIYSSNGEGTLTIIQKNKLQFSVLKNLPTQIGARTICINPETHYLYLPVADYDKAPAPTTENPHPRSPIKPGTFTILEIAP